MVLEKINFPVGGIFSLDPWNLAGTGLGRIQNRLKEMSSSRQASFCNDVSAVFDFACAQNDFAGINQCEGVKNRILSSSTGALKKCLLSLYLGAAAERGLLFSSIHVLQERHRRR